MKRNYNLVVIGLILLLSLITQITLSNQKQLQVSDKTNEIQQVQASADQAMFIKYPELDKTSFSPYSSPGYMDYVSLLFRPQMDINYSCNVTAMPRPLNIPNCDFPYLLYLNQSNKLGLFLVRSEYSLPYWNLSIIMVTSSDNGTTWSEPRNITQIVQTPIDAPVVSYTCHAAVELDGIIHFIYRFNNQTLYYMNSTDEGLHWSTPKCIQNNTIPYITPFELRMSMAVDPSNKTIHFVTATSRNSTDNGLYYFNSTDFGITWSVPQQLPITGSEKFGFPDLSFNTTGAAFLSVTKCITSSNYETYIAEMPNGLWNLGTLTQIVGGERNNIISCIDQTQNRLIFINQSVDSDNRNSYIYKCQNSDLTNYTLFSPMSHKIGEVGFARIISINGTLYFTSTSDYSGIYSPVVECISEPLNITQNSGFAQGGFDAEVVFNGRKNGLQVPFEYFYLEYKAYNWTIFGSTATSYSATIRRDDIEPIYSNINYNQYISPQNIDGNFDSLDFNFTSSEDVEYNYKILSDTINPIFESGISSSMTTKEDPRIIMDGNGRIFAFYLIDEGETNRLFYQVSENGGITWSNARALTKTGYDNAYYSIHRDRGAIYVFTAYKPIYDLALLKTTDGGDTWLEIEVNSSLDAEFITCTQDGVFYAITNPESVSEDAIFRSTDGGKTWEDIYEFDYNLNSKYGLCVDDVNQRLYIINKTGLFSELFSFDLTTFQMSQYYMYDNSFSGIFRAGEHDLRLTLAKDLHSNTTLQLEFYTNAWAPYGHEIWKSTNNGTTWNCISNTSFTETSPPAEDNFFDSDSDTHLRILIEQREGIDTVILEGESRIVYRETGTTTRNVLETIDYRGINFNNDYLGAGQYQIELAIYDAAKNRNVTLNTFYVDNSVPSIYNITWNQSPIDPLPKNPSNVTFNVNDTEGNLNNIELYYRHSGTSWSTATVSYKGGTSYEVEIPGSLTSTRLEFYITATDLAGNIRIENNNQSYYGWDDPVIEYVVLTLSKDQSTYDELPVRVVFTKGQEAIDSVKIVTDFGVNITLSYQDNAYSGNVPKYFDKDQFSYQIIYQDKWGRIGLCQPPIIHTRPTIKIATITMPARDLKVTTNDKLAFSIRFDENSMKYIQTVKVNYQINSGSWQETILTNASGLFTGEIGPFYDSENVHYYLVYTDISGNETIIRESEGTFALIPAMPKVQLDTTGTLIIILISAVVGVVLGLGYSTALRTQQRDPFMTYSDAYKTSLNERKNMTKEDVGLGAIYILNDPIMNYRPPSQSKKTLIGVFSIAILAAAALYYEWIVKFYEMATAIAVIVFLIVILLFNIVMERSAEAASRNKKDLGKATILGLFFLIFIFGALALIFWVGSNMKWFNYYVYEDRTTIGSFLVPTLWISVATTYFTSMLLVVFTTLSSIKKLWIRVKEYAENGSPLFDVFLFREKEILSIKQQIIYKTLAFIALVAVAVISATNLSTYSNLGMLALIPFIITSLLCMIFLGKKRMKAQQAVSIQPIVKCPSCSAMVTSGTFCSVCGKGLVLDLTEKSMKVKCAHCNAPNEDQSKFCRICGATFQTQEHP